MIITRAPFRVSFAGGGSDIAAFYRRRTGAVLSATIDKHVFITVHPYFNPKQTLLKYSRTELVDSVDAIRHPLFREAVRDLCPAGGVELCSTADVPAGTGLGSSSTFCVALLHALNVHAGRSISREQLAREACRLEIEKLREPIGKQDQYAAAYGGLSLYEFHGDERVTVTGVEIDHEMKAELEGSLRLFYTGDQRETGTILQDQIAQIASDTKKFDNQCRMVELAYRLQEALVERNIEDFGRLLHEGWMLKRTLSAKISNSRIDQYYERALEHGALGGKLLGAGGGGFLLICSPRDKQPAVSRALSDLVQLEFRFDWNGAQLVHAGDVDRGTSRGAP